MVCLDAVDTLDGHAFIIRAPVEKEYEPTTAAFLFFLFSISSRRRTLAEAKLRGNILQASI